MRRAVRPNRPADHGPVAAAGPRLRGVGRPARARPRLAAPRSVPGRPRPARVAHPEQVSSLGRPAAPWFVVAAAGVGLAITLLGLATGFAGFVWSIVGGVLLGDIVGGLRARWIAVWVVLATAVVLATGCAVGLGVDYGFPASPWIPAVFAAVYVGTMWASTSSGCGGSRPSPIWTSRAAPPTSSPPPASGCGWPTTCTTSSGTRWRSSRSRASWRPGCSTPIGRAPGRSWTRCRSGTGVTGRGAVAGPRHPSHRPRGRAGGRARRARLGGRGARGARRPRDRRAAGPRRARPGAAGGHDERAAARAAAPLQQSRSRSRAAPRVLRVRQRRGAGPGCQAGTGLVALGRYLDEHAGHLDAGPGSRRNVPAGCDAPGADVSGPGIAARR